MGAVLWAKMLAYSNSKAPRGGTPKLSCQHPPNCPVGALSPIAQCLSRSGPWKALKCCAIAHLV
eukprot:6401301-Alexandrium_andersonii.AAC.1